MIEGKTILSMSAGRNHTLARCSDGTVARWGLNYNGQIGPANNGGTSNVPAISSSLGVLSARRVIAVAAGETHSLALSSDGSVAAWGTNGFGEMGAGNNTPSTASYGTVIAATLSIVLGNSDNGGSADVDFELGLTTQYGTPVGAFPSTATHSTETAVSATCNGLSPGTTYQYRTRAFGPNGIVSGHGRR